LRQKNSFAGIARNHGLQFAKGEYVHFMDVDDEVLPEGYNGVIKLADDLKADYIKVRAKAIDVATGKEEQRISYSLENIENKWYNCLLTAEEGIDILLQTAPTPWSAIVRKSYIETKGLTFNHLRCANDRSFFMQAISHTDKLAISDEVLVVHYVNNSQSLVGIRPKYFECNIQSYKCVEEAIHDIPAHIRRKILSAEIKELMSWYLRFDEEYGIRYGEMLKAFLKTLSFEQFTIKALRHSFIRQAYEMLDKNIVDVLKLAEIEHMEDYINSSKQIIIYGAGRVAREIMTYICRQNVLKEKIQFILVKTKENNPEEIEGKQVFSLSDISISEDSSVLIATFEKYQAVIIRELNDAGYTNIRTISDKLYNQVCIENNYFQDALLQPEQYEQALKDWYQEIKGTPLNLDNPQTYNEKIQWIKLHGITPHITRLTDKYAVREWIKEQIGEDYLVPLIGVWNSFDEIDIDSLPKRFALKCNHGCDWNAIVKDKDIWDIEEAKKKFDKWMHMNFAFHGGLQLQYKDIVPKIIAEEYLENADGDLFDYKFWCFDGKVEFIMFLSERAKELRMNNYDRNWNLLPFTYNYTNTNKPIEKPEKLEEMIALAEKLATGFPHVRVDFYQLNNGTIKFGEMTFTSCNGRAHWSDEAVNRRLGELIRLPESNMK